MTVIIAAMAPSRGDLPDRFHAVRFYESQASLARTVADLLGEGIRIGQPALVIATRPHRDAIVAELRSRGIDTDRLAAASELVLLDARTTLATFMVGAEPDPVRFNRHLAAAVDGVGRRRQDCRLRAYGEMVDLLCQDGLFDAALRLETLWNALALTHDFSLLCGYAVGSFYKHPGMREICEQHSHVMPADNRLRGQALAR
jgi:hypothetical protein